jgi:uncharacterized FlaG/YvyC family protein
MIPNVTASRAQQAVVGVAASPPSVSEPRDVAQAVAQLNGSGLLGANRELSLALVPGTRKFVIYLFNPQTNEVLDQFPAAHLLEFAAALTAQKERSILGAAGLPTYA